MDSVPFPQAEPFHYKLSLISITYITIGLGPADSFPAGTALAVDMVRNECGEGERKNEKTGYSDFDHVLRHPINLGIQLLCG